MNQMSKRKLQSKTNKGLDIFTIKLIMQYYLPNDIIIFIIFF